MTYEKDNQAEGNLSCAQAVRTFLTPMPVTSANTARQHIRYPVTRLQVLRFRHSFLKERVHHFRYLEVLLWLRLQYQPDRIWNRFILHPWPGVLLP